MESGQDLKVVQKSPSLSQRAAHRAAWLRRRCCFPVRDTLQVTNEHIMNWLDRADTEQCKDMLQNLGGICISIASTSLEVLQYAQFAGIAFRLVNQVYDQYEKAGDTHEGVKELLRNLEKFEKNIEMLAGTTQARSARDITEDVFNSLKFCHKYFERSSLVRCLRARDWEKESNTHMARLEVWKTGLLTDLATANEAKKAKMWRASSMRGTQLVGDIGDYPGVKDKVKDVKMKLLNGAKNRAPYVIGLHGMGGMGKTTLAAAVHDDVDVRNHFKVVCWVTVRPDPTEEQKKKMQESIYNALQKEIDNDGGERVATANPFSAVENPDQGRNALIQKLATQQVLIVLDDVWKEEDQPLHQKDLKAAGSCLLITTRNNDVVHANGGESYPLQSLTKDESRSILCQSAFGVRDPPPGLKEVLEKVVTWGGGLPLALEVIGRAAKSSIRAKEASWWEHFLEVVNKKTYTETQGKKVYDDLLTVLRFSYDCASDEAKEAFVLLAAMLPRVGFWPSRFLCQVFLASVLGDSFILDELEERSLIKWDYSRGNEKPESDDGIKDHALVINIHDQLKDLAVSIAKEECRQFSLLADVKDRVTGDSSTKHMSIQNCEITTLPSTVLRHNSISSIIVADNGRLKDVEAHEVEPAAIIAVNCGELQRIQLSGRKDKLRMLWCKGLPKLQSFGSECESVGLPLSGLRVGDFTTLQVLMLSNSNLLGTIPCELGSLQMLTMLDLSGNQLNGDIPCQLGNLIRLQLLLLHRNKLTGGIPLELGKLSSLRKLSLYKNKLSGSIPSKLGSLLSLEKLLLNSNNLTGGIPLELGKLSTLQKLSLRSNELSGVIPSELGNLLSLKVLCLNNNKLTGSIPLELCKLSSVQKMSINENELRGSIPSELGSLLCLQELCLDKNKLTGGIPLELGNLSSLQKLSLRSNELSGIIPSELGSLLCLQVLWLSKNKLTGGIPLELGKLSSLQMLSLRKNELSGVIPSELGNLLSLEVLRLNNNELIGSIPLELGKLSTLQTLSLHNNELSGTIPSELGSLLCLQELLLSDNKLTGSIPLELGKLSSLQKLTLCNNELRGVIPSELGCLLSLKVLRLNNNGLIGSIPLELGRLSSLQNISLDGNELSGSIPPELGKLSSLQTLDLSENELSGSIPSELGSLLCLQELLLNNNKLTGGVPPELGKLKSVQMLHLNDNELSGTIPSELGCLSALQSLSLSHNCLIEFMAPELSALKSLQRLSLAGCYGLKLLPSLTQMTMLQVLDLAGCSGIQEIPQLPPQEMTRHVFIQCNACKTVSIVGIRYKSCAKREYNLCPSCRYKSRAKRDYNLCPSCFSVAKDKGSYEHVECLQLPHHLQDRREFSCQRTAS